MTFLTDGHVTLRAPRDDDAKAVVAAVAESLPTLQPWMPWAGAGYDEHAARQWIRGEHDPTAVGLLILDAAGDIAGSCGLNRLDREHRRANLGYWLRPDRTGLGLATRATRLLALHGLTTMGLHRIEIVMSVHNEPSRRVAERAGATHEGTLRGRLLLDGSFHDAHLFSLVASDVDSLLDQVERDRG